MKKEKLLIIDSNALVHRAFHALPPLSSQEGELTNAVYGFASLLLKAINEMKPDYIVACFDLPEPTFRHKEFDEYKAHRSKTPEDLIPQFDKVKEVVRAFGIPIFEKAGFEADDLLGTISLISENNYPNVENVILTGDLDTLQLIDKNTVVYTLKKGISDVIIYDKQAVVDRYELEPYQMIDFKGLKGDPSDNIPGVPGIGDKTASTLLKEYKTLDNVYLNLELMPKRLSDKLNEYKDQAFFSKKLATIKRDVEIDFDIKKAKFGEFDKNDLISLFRELNFFTLIPRLDFKEEKINDKNENATNLREIKESDFEKIKKSKYISIALLEDNVSICIEGKDLLLTSIEKIKDILEDESVKKVGHDLKSLTELLSRKSINMKGGSFDIMIASYLLSPGLRKYELKKLILEHLGEDVADDELKEKEAYYVCLIKEELEKKLKQNDLWSVFVDIEMPLVDVLVSMELAGIGVDPKKMKKLSDKLEKKIKEKEKIIYRFSKDKEFNINSPSQLGPILFEELDVQEGKKVKKTKTGSYATGESELEKYKKNHKIIQEVLDYRELSKLKNTYADALPKLINKETKKIHTTYNQTGTATGRLSSSDPNLQNIPQKGEFSKDIREAFIAGKGFSFVAYDYSQIELRIIAHLSNDKKMIKIFNSGGDIHAATAMEINKVSESEVTKEMRRMAKVLNFGILFGMGIKGFSAAAEVSMEDAKKFIEGYFENFSEIGSFIQDSIEDAKKDGYVKTELGRKRWLPDLKSKNWILRNSAERMAQNMPVQGLEADILKLAMIDVYNNIIKNNKNIKLILQVHDELVFEIKDDIIKDVDKDIRDCMENIYKLKVPILVDASKGKDWGNMSII